jgi:TRAP-type C4-dicarboxylate transport system permease small subunit
MPLGPLGVTALLAALDWGAWDWATNSNQTTVGVIAGLLMAPIAVAFAWSLMRVLIALARVALQRLSAQSHLEPVPAPATAPATATGAPFDIEAQNERIAA